MNKEKKIIGWREFVAIPELGIKSIKAKSDTGARTSSLHITDLEIIQKGKYTYAEFNVHPEQHSAYPCVRNRHRVMCFRQVKSSNGASTRRPVIKTTIAIGKTKKEIEITLVNRSLMGFRMLLGRTALREDFTVDAGKSFLLSKKEQKKGK